MPRYLAIEWDSREARIAVAEGDPGRVRIERAVTVETAKMAQTIAGLGVGRAETLVAVGRASIELKLLSLPPAPDDELPDLTRFQAQSEFNTLGEDWPLDYLPIDSDPAQPRTVLAAAIAPQTVSQILDTCREAGLTAKRLVLRPCAAASLLQRHRAADTACVRLLVDVLTDEADLTVLVAETVIFMRTARLPVGHSPAERSAALVTEMRRTIGAAQNQLKGESVQEIVLCGVGEEYDALVEQIDAQLKLPTTRFNPFHTLDLDPSLRAQLPQHPGRFAPLLGMILDEADGVRHGFDFLSPRKRPAPPNRRKFYYQVGGIAAASIAALWLVIWALLSSRESANAELRTQFARDAARLKQFATVDEEIREIEGWLAGDVVWLDEFAELSNELPPAEEVMLTKVRVGVVARGASMQLDGLARSTTSISELDSRLRDKRHRVDGRGGTRDDRNASYPWQFTSTVHLENTGSMREVRRPGARGGRPGAPASASAPKGK
jgi:Tfp pilus assembly PilM family ATPase